MEVTQSQRNAAESLVNRIMERRKTDKGEYEKSVEDLFYFILKILAKETEKYEYPDGIERGFSIFLNYKFGQKTIEIRDLANSKNFVFLDVTSLKDGKKVMKEVADMFNDISQYRAEFHPYSRDNRGVLSVYLDY